MQVAHLLLDRVEADFRQSPVGTAGHLAVWDLQIDNQLLTTAHPVVLASASRLAQQVRTHTRSLPHMSSSSTFLQMSNVMSVLPMHHPFYFLQANWNGPDLLITGQPFFEARWETMQHNPSILYFKTAYMQLQVTYPSHSP